MNIPGRLHPVSLYYAPEVLEDPIDAALVSIFQVHTDHPRGDILVFLTGQEEIENMQSLIEEHLCDLPDGADKVILLNSYLYVL